MEDRHPAIEFVTDGRFYVPSGRTEGEFIVVFGSLVSGPKGPAPGTFITPFIADVMRANHGDSTVFEARLDFPLEDEPEPREGPSVLLYGASLEEVPAGSRVTSRSAG